MPALIDVNENARLGFARGRFYATNPRLQKASQVGPLFGFVVGLRREVLIIPGDLELGHRPRGAAGDLVADLDLVGHGAGVLQRLDGVEGVLLPRLFQAVDMQSPPGDGNVLVLGVGPGVGKVQTQKERGARGFDLPGQRNGVLQRVVGSAADRRDEDAQAEKIPAVAVQYFPFFGGLAVLLVVERPASAAASSTAGIAAGRGNGRDVTQKELGQLGLRLGLSRRRSGARQKQRDYGQGRL